MKLIRTVPELREIVADARRRGARIGLVPTMGAFHAGHVSLMQAARATCDVVIVSLFVNPTQFNEPADLARYPRDEARDAAMARDAGVDVLFAPAVQDVYPADLSTTVDVGGVTESLEGEARGPAHFRGVSTVVCKLLNMAQPHVVVVGQKDAQQALLIRRMVRDLDMPVTVVIAPTVREPDGLAMSSRNVLLAPEDRTRAAGIFRALDAVRAALGQGERDMAAAMARGTAILRAAAITPEYFAAVNAQSLQPVVTFDGETLVAFAGRFGAVRLIDNVIVTPTEQRA